MKFYSDEEFLASQDTQQRLEAEDEFGCNFCYDKRKKKNKELFFFDQANNLRVCVYCPYCGRYIQE